MLNAMPSEEALDALLRTDDESRRRPQSSPTDEIPVEVSPDMIRRRETIDELEELRDNAALKIGIGGTAEAYFKEFETGPNPLTRFEVFEQTQKEEREAILRKIEPHLTQEDLSRLAQDYSSQFVDVMVDKGVFPPEIMRQIEKNRQPPKNIYNPVKTFHNWLERLAPRQPSPQEIERDHLERLKARKHFDQEYFDFLNRGLEIAIAKYSPQQSSTTAE